MAALVAASAASAVEFLLLAAVPAFFFFFFFFGSGGWKRRQVLLPPVVGTIFHQFLNLQRLHDYHTELSRLHKNYRLLSPFGRQLYTADPAVVEHILKTNFNNYGKGLYNYINLRDLFGDGIFAVDGDKWRHQRKLASFNFSTKSLRDFSGSIFKNSASDLARILSAYANSNEQFDMQELLMKSTMDSTFKIAFGFELDCMGGSNQDGVEFAKAFDKANEFTLLRYVNVFWRITRLLGVGSEAALKQNLKVIDEFVYKVMDIRFKEIANAHQEKGDDILSKFLEEIKHPQTTMDTRYLRDIILNFVIAGKDTTAGSLAWFFYLICKDPSVQEKIHREVKRVVLLETKECTDFVEFSRNINDESLNNLHYLHASLTETLRLFPENKVCFSDDILPGGYNVSKGDIVFFQPYAMGRMEYLWGEDAESFRPERWLDDEGIFQPESPFKFVAFQAGPRICLGREFAYRQMKTFAAVLLYFFQFKLSDEEKVVRYKTMTTLQIDQGLYLQASSR
ncbi:cytochrome P450 704C1-like isoform X3 [Zingiber officinale]|uniref:cytochrome P450 704C1-like isoform X3 n=1 Tax=Zingiber officinale TaxID=94328 RepID=UPI001C4B29FB|nr:cytochrome P450 704C1-like isoform X3 [Zingiber officinale]